MPIDYKNYPKNWKSEIRQAILRRAENKCEFCGIANGLIISRWQYGNRHLVKDLWNGPVWELDEFGKLVDSDYSWHLSDWGSDHVAKIVLTVAHLNHNISDNEESNLKALCQKCHLNLDKHHHVKNSRETRNKKKGNYKLDI